MIIYEIYNKKEYLEEIKVIKEDLKRMVLILEEYNNAMDLQDQIEYVLNNLDNDYSNYNNEIPNRYIEVTNEDISFNFITYYEELDEFCNNEVIISKDWKNLTFVYEYGNIDFATTYELNNRYVNSKEAKEPNPIRKYYPIKRGN